MYPILSPPSERFGGRKKFDPPMKEEATATVLMFPRSHCDGSIIQDFPCSVKPLFEKYIKPRMLDGAGRCVVPLSNGDPACWRPAGGRGSLCGNGWLLRSPLHPVCRFAQDDTVGYRGVVPKMFGIKYSTVKLNNMAFYFPD